MRAGRLALDSGVALCFVPLPLSMGRPAEFLRRQLHRGELPATRIYLGRRRPDNCRFDFVAERVFSAPVASAGDRVGNSFGRVHRGHDLNSGLRYQLYRQTK